MNQNNKIPGFTGVFYKQQLVHKQAVMSTVAVKTKEKNNKLRKQRVYSGIPNAKVDLSASYNKHKEHQGKNNIRVCRSGQSQMVL